MCAYLSYIANFLIATAVFFTIVQQDNVNDLLCNFAGLLVVIDIDDMIGEWAIDYIMKDDNKDDEDFLKIKMTNIEYKFAERITLLLMLTFSIWCSLVYYLLCNYVEGTDRYMLKYIGLTYVAFGAWPVCQLFFKIFCGCCITCCCNRPESEGVNGEIDGKAKDGDFMPAQELFSLEVEQKKHKQKRESIGENIDENRSRLKNINEQLKDIRDIFKDDDIDEEF